MKNRYREGAMAPLSREYTLTDLTVTGAIPDYLDGRYLRNGPNPIEEIDPELYHWFVGDGMVHGIRIRDGKAEWYRNRWVRGPQAARLLGEPRRGGHFGTASVGANTNVIGHAGKTLALIEAGVANYELTDELDTVGVCDFDGTLTGGYTAHPKRDPDTGELHAVSYRVLHGNTVQYSVIGADGRARRTVDIEVTGCPMMHDFSLTEKHVILYDLPVTFDVRQAVLASDVVLVRAGDADGRDLVRWTMTIQHTTPAVRPIDVMTGLTELTGLQVPRSPLMTRLAQGVLEAGGRVIDPFDA